MKKLLTLITLFSFSIVICQERFENKQYEFSIEKPNKWIVANNDEMIKNLDKYELTDEKLAELLKNNKGSILLTSFYKYNIKSHAGLIPTIKINVRANPTKNFNDFKSMISQSSKGFKTVFPDFAYIDPPTEITISEIKSVYFIGSYTMKSQNGDSINIRSRTYAIPYKNYLFQVNFIDGPTDEDCSKEFDNLIKTIKIGN